MTLFGGVIPITSISFFLFCVFAILFGGYALGRIKVKGISLGDAGVFLVALLFGALCFNSFEAQLDIDTTRQTAVYAGYVTEEFAESASDKELYAAIAEAKGYGENLDEDAVNKLVEDGLIKTKTNYAEKALEVIESFGLILFVTSVGFIAGPKFFGNFKRNFKSYVMIGLIIIVAGGLSAAGCIALGEVVGYGGTIENQDGFVAMIVGLLSGSLTSTPAFSAAKATVADEYQALVSVGHGIAYIFGVIGVVLFVQLIPKLTKANMEEERAKLVIKDGESKKPFSGKLFHIDHMGIAVFALAAILGTVLGKVKIPLSAEGLDGTCFSLTTTGGCLLVSLIMGHFTRIGTVSIMPDTGTLKLFRELGLVLFLVGAGIPGGAEFVANFDPMYFVYGIIMTIIPMIIGFLFAKYVLKLSLLNNLGSITGGMTSTPALGTLISTAGTEDVAAAYASTYPIALIAVVLVSQFLIILL